MLVYCESENVETIDVPVSWEDGQFKILIVYNYNELLFKISKKKKSRIVFNSPIYKSKAVF